MAGYDDSEEALFEAYLNEQNLNPTASLGKRGDYLQTQIDKYRAGDITYPETLFGLTRSAGGVVTDAVSDVVGGAASALSPDLGFTDWLASTTPVKKIGEGVNYVEENYPRTSNIVGGLFGIADLAGKTALARSTMSPREGLLRNFVDNMPNKLASFYSGLGGQAQGLAQAFGGGAKNTFEQNLTPRGLALRDANISLELKNKTAAAYKKVEELKIEAAAAKEKIRDSNIDPKEKQKKLEEIDSKLSGEIATLGKNVEAQKQHSVMTNTQYEVEVPPLIKESTNRVNLRTGDYDLKTFKDFYPDVDDEIFEVITANQKMKPGEGKLIMRNPFGFAAGQLRNDVVSGRKSSKNSRSSKIAAATKAAFDKQDKVYGFSDADSFLGAVASKKLTTLQQEAVNNPSLKKQLRQAFKDDPLLNFVQDAEEMNTRLKKRGVKLNKKLIESAFQGSGRKPFKDTDELIASLEKQGLKVSPEEKKKAKARGYVIASDSFVSGAIDLGGVNAVHAVYPNGKKLTFVNDGYDLKGRVPFGAKKLVNVAHWEEDMLGPNPTTNGPLKDSGPVQRPKEPSPFSNVMTLQQQKGAEDILNFEPPITNLNRAKALRNNALLGSMGAAVFANPLLSSAGEDEEE